jgi:hypothetical protein
MSSEASKIPIKTVLLGSLRLDVPSHWDSGATSDGRWWTGDKERTHTLYLATEYFEVADDAQHPRSTPTANTEPYVAEIVEFLNTIPLIGNIEIDRIQSGFVVQAFWATEIDGGQFRSYRWYVHNGRSDYVVRVRLALVVRPGTADADVMPLVEHFRAQAHALRLFARSDDGPEVASLQDVSVNDLFAIRIPDDWSYEHEERNGIPAVWCYPRDPHLGKLLIAWEHGELRPEFAEGRDPDIADKLADLRDRHFIENEERRRISRTRFAAPLGVIIHTVDDEKPRPYAEEEFDRLYVRHHQWFYVTAGRREFLTVFFNLTIPLRWISQPEAGRLVTLIAGEATALRLLPAFDPAA